MSGAAMLMLAALALGAAALAELLRGAGLARSPGSVLPALPSRLAPLAERLQLAPRLARAAAPAWLTVPALMWLKAGTALAALTVVPAAAPVAPGRLSLVVAIGLPIAGFFVPDALLERRAAARGRALRGSLPNALDLLATAAAAGRAPLSGLEEISRGEGALARELSMLVAETSCGAPQRSAFEALRRRVPAPELAAMCGVIERSRRYGSPLADQLLEQASSLRSSQRRQIAESAAKAAPKIQLAVALLLVPSVLLMIAAGLLSHLDSFLAGI